MVFSLFHQAITGKRPKTKAVSAEGEAENDPLKVGPILFNKGIVSQRDLEAAVETQNARRAAGQKDSTNQLGEILISNGACTRKQLEDALAEQFTAHLPDSSKANSAMDELDRVLAKSEARGEEMKKATQAVKRETLSMNVSALKTATG